MTAQPLPRNRPLSISDSLGLDLKRATDVLRFTREENRVLKLANAGLARRVDMLEVQTGYSCFC